MGFRSLQHFKIRRSTFRGLCLPATFRLQGLATLLTVFSLRTPAGSVSHRRRSWDSPFGAFPSRKVPGAFPPESTHLPFLHPVEPPAEASDRPGGRGSWVSALPRVPGAWIRVERTNRWLLPWVFSLLGSPAAALIRISPDLLSRAFRTGPQGPRPPAPQSLNRLLPGPSRKPQRTTACPRDNPCRVPAPVRSETFRRSVRPGYEFTSRCVVHYCRPPSDLWAGNFALPELPGTPEVLSIRDLPF
jgi:hypothetical protein